MRRSHLFATLVLAVASRGLAAQVPADLVQAMKARDQAIDKADVQTWERLTTTDFASVDETGHRVSRADRVTALKKAKTADFQVRLRERQAHIEVLEARAEKLRLQNAELGGSSDREAKLGDKIDRLRSQTREIEDLYGLEPGDSDDEDEEEGSWKSLSARKPLSRLVKRRKR